MGALLKEEMFLTASEFEYFRTTIFKLAGISLSDAKLELVQSRLRSRALKKGFRRFDEYSKYLQGLSEHDEEWQSFVNLLTTNKTDWFRESKHFDYLLEDFLPQWIKSGKKDLKVWCAASSTGEEPYTLAMVLKNGLKGTDVNFSIFASDIDTRVLSIAENGVYKKERLWQIPDQYQDSFAFGTGEISSWMKVKKEIKQHVQFGQINLAHGPYPWTDEFDLIFCRNVLIYFNQKTIQDVVESLYPAAKKNALLFIAHSESLQNVSTQWNYKKASIYSKGRL